MGSFFTSFHIRTDSNEAVIEALKPIVSARAFVSSCSRQWIGVFTEQTEDQDQDEIRNLALNLSKSLAAPVLAFMVHDSDVFCYWLAANGKLDDHYNSRPDYFESVTAEARTRLAGKPEQLLPLCEQGTKLDAIRGALRQRTPRGQAPDPARPDPVLEEARAARLAALLGIKLERATMGFADVLEADAGTRQKFKLVKPTNHAAELQRGKKLADAVSRGSVAEVEALFKEGVPLRALAVREALLAAATSGNVDLLRCFVEAGVNLNARFPSGSNLLGYAISSGKPAAVEYLLLHGARLAATDDWGRTPLITAAFCSASDEMIAALVKAGANVNQPADTRFSSHGPVQHGVTPLMCAVQFSDVETVKALLAHGADRTMKDASGKNALAYANAKLIHLKGSVEMVEANRNPVRESAPEAAVAKYEKARDFLKDRLNEFQEIVGLLASSNPSTGAS